MLLGMRLALALTLAAFLAAVGCRRSDERSRAPHRGTDVVVIVLDTLRPDHLGFYGYARETAPWLAEVAARSRVFTRAFSTSSWTAPATASLVTGLYPTRHGVIMGLFAHRARVKELEAGGNPAIAVNRIPGGVTTLADLLAASGRRAPSW